MAASNCQICGDFAILILFDEKVEGYVGYCHEHSPLKPTSDEEAEREKLWAKYDERFRRVSEEYTDYFKVLSAEQERTNTCGPHCDSFVLHRPSDCTYCSHYPALHEARQKLKIAYTGIKPKDDERPCPAERMRTLETIGRWYGNVAYPEEEDVDE